MAKKQNTAHTPRNNKPLVQDEESPFVSWIPVILAFVVFAIGLTNQMTGVDDHAATVENPAVNDFSLWSAFTNFNLGMYAPVTWMAYALAYVLGKDNAVWYHLLSLVIHVLNTRLVILLLTKLELRRSVWLPVAILFAIHPIQVESVSWIAGFSTPLYCFFSLLSFNYYLKYTSGNNHPYQAYLIALGMFVLGCLAKSAAVTVPITLIVLDLWRKPRALSTTRQWLGYIPFFLIALGFGLMTIHTREVSGTVVGATSNGFSALERILLVCYAPLFYISKMLVPLKLSIYYSFDKINGQLPYTYYIAPLIMAGLALGAWYYRKTAPYVGIGLLFFLSNVIVTLPFATLGSFELCADHYNYLACIGIFYILVEGIQAIQNRYPSLASSARSLAWVWGIAICILCFRQIRIWKDTITVISNAIENGYTHKGMMYMGRGVEFGDNGRMPEAMKDFTRALELNPELKDAYKFRGSLYAQAGQIDLAVKDLEKYLTYDSTDVVTWNNMAMIFMRQNQLEKSLKAFTRTIELKPDAVISYENRSRIYQMMGNVEKANADMQKAKELSSKPK